MEPPIGSRLGERLIHPQTIWDRIVRWGIFCVALAAIVGTVGVAFRFLVWPLRVVFPPVALALVVVYLLNPLVSRLHRRGIGRGLSVAIVYLTFLAVIGVALGLTVPIVARQIGGFINQLPDYVQKATQEINQFAERRDSSFRINLTPEQIKDTIVGNRDTIVGIIGGVRSVAFSLIHILITLVIGIILSIYILLDLPKIQQWIRSMLPERRRDELSGLADRVGGVLGAFFRGQLLVAAFVGVASALGLTFIAKIPFAAVVGLIAGVFNLVPLIGPFIGAIPAVFLGLLSGEPIRALWAMLVLLAVQQIDNHIISPNVIGRTVKLHPITVMLALLAAGSLAGIFGMLLVIPVIGAVKMIASHMWEKRAVRDAIAAAIPDSMEPARVSAAIMDDAIADGTERVLIETEAEVEVQLQVDGKPVKRKRASAPRRTTRGSPAGRRRKRSGSR